MNHFLPLLSPISRVILTFRYCSPRDPDPVPLSEVDPEPWLPDPDVPLGPIWPPDSISLSEWDPDSRPYPVPLLDSGGFASPDRF